MQSLLLYVSYTFMISLTLSLNERLLDTKYW
jgi:hypothetical protein